MLQLQLDAYGTSDAIRRRTEPLFSFTIRVLLYVA